MTFILKKSAPLAQTEKIHTLLLDASKGIFLLFSFLVF